MLLVQRQQVWQSLDEVADHKKRSLGSAGQGAKLSKLRSSSLKLYFLLAVSTNHGSLSLRKARKCRLQARASGLIWGLISLSVSCLTKTLVENLLRG